MNVYQLVDDDGFKTMGIVADPGSIPTDWFSGKPIAHVWRPLQAQLLGRREKLRDGDLAGHPRAPFFSERAIQCLRDILKETAEVLALTCEGEAYYAINIVNVIDALDEEKCEIFRVSSGKIVRVEKYVFHEDRVADQYVFKIPQLLRGSYVFVTDKFKKRVEDCDLKGFRFERL